MNKTLSQMTLIGLVLLVSTLLLVTLISRRSIGKIEQLESRVRTYTQNRDVQVAAQIAAEASGNDEIASLGQGISAMITEIDEAITTLENTNRALVEANETAAKMKDLANRDSLTGVRNRTSYDAEAKTIDDDLKDGPLAFGIIMVDLNYLKKMNDTYGHDLGNVSLRTICDLICTVFANSDVFRIGGDEFVVILRAEDYQNHKELLAELDRRLQQIQSDDSLDEWQKVSAAVGVAIYDPEQDEGVESVFKRADMRMYENKKRMKALRQ